MKNCFGRNLCIQYSGLIFSCFAFHCHSCDIHGTDSGQCVYNYHPSFYGNDINAIRKSTERWSADMPFCGLYIANYYPPCVPKPAFLPPDANYPYGRFSNHTVRTKDAWVNATVTKILREQIALETLSVLATQNSSFFNSVTSSIGGNDEMEEETTTSETDQTNLPSSTIKAQRFYNNLDCQDAFKRYMCWINFPRCDNVFVDTSLPMCQSACQNFFRVCGYPLEMHYCPIDANFVDESGESNNNFGASNVITNDVTKNNFFPGMPFHPNEYLPDSDGDPKIVCTPSIKGAAYIGKDMNVVIKCVALVAAVYFLIAFF